MAATTQDATLSPPRWLLAGLLLVMLSAHSQLTLRHWGLWLTGSHQGTVLALEAGNDPSQTVLSDPFAVYAVNELAGRPLWLGDHQVTVVANEPTRLLVAAAPELVTAWVAEVKASRDDETVPYLAGPSSRSALVRLALRLPKANITPSDVLLGLWLLLAAAWVLRRRAWATLSWPPWPIWAILAVTLWSLWAPLRPFDSWELDAQEQRSALADGLRELRQVLELFLAAFLAWRWGLRTAWLRRWLPVSLAVLALAMLAVAGWEYAQVVSGHTLRGLADMGEVDGLLGMRWLPSRPKVTGSEASRTALALYAAMMAPLLLAWSRGLAKSWQRWAGTVLALLLLLLILHLPLLLIAVLACALVAAQCPQRAVLPGTLLGMLAILTIGAWLIPQMGAIWLDSAAVYRHSDRFGQHPMPAKGQDGRHYEASYPWQQKVQERQVALNAISFSPLLGHGLGSYQDRINSFYSFSKLNTLTLTKSSVNLMEKDAHGLWLVWGVETGALGVAALLALLLWSARLAWETLPRLRSPSDRVLLIGALAGILVLLLAGWWTSWMVRGLQLLPAALAENAKAEGPPPGTKP
jgi:hypothetical protein